MIILPISSVVFRFCGGTRVILPQKKVARLCPITPSFGQKRSPAHPGSMIHSFHTGSAAGLSAIAHILNSLRRADDDGMPPVTKIRFAANGRLLRGKSGYRLPLSGAPLAHGAACRLDQDDPAGHVPDIRTLEARHPQHAGSDERAFDRGGPDFARF